MKYPNLELIEETFKDFLKQTEKDNKTNTFDICMFSQMWGSTALGFSKIGCSAMTKAYTTIINQENSCIYGVFFDNRFAYMVENPTDDFFEDIKNQNMEDVKKSIKYIRE